MKEGFGSWIQSASDRSSDSIRILHVDDDVDFAELTSLYLERESDSFEVVSAKSGSDGLERLQNEHFDCIVSDYQMPGQSGLEFFRNIPKDHSNIPFILFTGKGSEEIASEAFTAGVTDYLQKEVGPDQYTVLANRISAAVNRFWSQQRVELTRRRFQTLVEESSDAIFVVDTTGQILYSTPAAENILGLPPSELVGTSGFDRIHPDDVESAADEFQALIETPEYRASAEFRYRHANGSWIWVEARGRNLLDNKDIGGLVIYVRDIDARKEDEQMIQERE